MAKALHTEAAELAEKIAAQFEELPADERPNAQRAAFHLFVLVKGMEKREAGDKDALAADAATVQEAVDAIGSIADAG